MQMAGPGAPVVQRGGRIAVLRAGRELWRSAGRFRAVAVFATVGPDAVAFSYERFTRSRSSESLYLARLGGRERELAVNETPLGWTSRGRLLTERFRDGFFGVYLRDGDGRLLGRVAANVREVRFQPATRTVLALSRSGVLERYRGSWRRLADLHALGFGRQASFEPLAGGLIGILQASHVVVLRPSGALFASARFPARGRSFTVAGHSGLVANASGSAVAFAVTSGDNGHAPVGRESVYVLRAGDRSGREVYSGTLRFAVCERWASLDWHGDWLLYATTEGKTVALNSRAPTRRIDLTRVVRRFSSTDGEGNVNAQLQWAKGRT